MEDLNYTGTEQIPDLSGKWKYREVYDYGLAEGEMILEQNGNSLSGRIIFTDTVKGEKPYMLQEFVQGHIDDLKINLKAYEVDIIDADHEVNYELDHWFGVLVDQKTIKGISIDNQEIEGSFIFEKIS